MYIYDLYISNSDRNQYVFHVIYLGIASPLGVNRHIPLILEVCLCYYFLSQPWIVSISFPHVGLGFHSVAEHLPRLCNGFDPRTATNKKHELFLKPLEVMSSDSSGMWVYRDHNCSSGDLINQSHVLCLLGVGSSMQQTRRACE